MFLNTCKRSVPSDQLVFFLVKPFSTWCSNSVLSPLTLWCSILQNTFKAFNICCDFSVQMVFLNLNTNFYSVVFDLFCIFRENTHEQQLIQAKILYQCPSRNILDFVYGGSHFSTGVHFSTCQTRKKSTPVTFFLHVRHVFLRPGVISLRRKMTPRSIFDGGRYSSLHRKCAEKLRMGKRLYTSQIRTVSEHSDLELHLIVCQNVYNDVSYFGLSQGRYC